MPNGIRAVSPLTTRTTSGLTPRASAAICAIAVSMPCPNEVPPEKTLTAPVPPTMTSAVSCGPSPLFSRNRARPRPRSRNGGPGPPRRDSRACRLPPRPPKKGRHSRPSPPSTTSVPSAVIARVCGISRGPSRLRRRSSERSRPRPAATSRAARGPSCSGTGRAPGRSRRGLVGRDHMDVAATRGEPVGTTHHRRGEGGHHRSRACGQWAPVSPIQASSRRPSREDVLVESNASSMWCCCSRAWLAAIRCSVRSSDHFTGRLGPQAQERHQQVFGVELSADAEAAARVGFQHVEAVFGQALAWGRQRPGG